jgi:hypothetical protein
VNVKFVTEVLSVTEIILRICVYIYNTCINIYMCVCVNVACIEALSGLATCCIVCFSVLNEISCIVEVGVVL